MIMYGSVGEILLWETPTGVSSGEIMFVHKDIAGDGVDYYSITSGSEPKDRYYLDSDAMSKMNVVNLSA